jgi:predicted Kef-type K+ transport protein
MRHRLNEAYFLTMAKVFGGIAVALVVGTALMPLILYAIGETVEHFTQ